ncbi:hypothetical protein [Saccharothrix sp. ALI-22-I]|uniref:hypothetical protein n=1 Tax=Saccharothrix sp. ALI-22-I TaxID=1933778 RepID=UPI001EE6FB59|nr:hypothetical protein [Saccharothrix sp. ALI-22-I]
MLSAIRYARDLVAEHEGVHVDPARLDLVDPAVYDMLCAAATVGVFQMDSVSSPGVLSAPPLADAHADWGELR